MIKEKLGDRLDTWLHRLLPWLFLRPINPHLLTATGAIVSLLAALAFAQGSIRVAGLLVACGGVFDLVDGVVARHHGTATPFGAFLDSTVDRLVDVAVLVGIVIHYAGAGETGAAAVAAVALTASVLTSYAKARGELFSASLDAGVLERGERIGLLIFGGVTGLLLPALWIIAVGGTVTVVQRCALAYRQLERARPATDVGETGR